MFVNNVKKLVIRVISCTRRVHSLRTTRTHTNHGKRLGQWNESKIGVVHGEAKIERKSDKVAQIYTFVLLYHVSNIRFLTLEYEHAWILFTSKSISLLLYVIYKYFIWWKSMLILDQNCEWVRIYSYKINMWLYLTKFPHDSWSLVWM